VTGAVLLAGGTIAIGSAAPSSAGAGGSVTVPLASGTWDVPAGVSCVTFTVTGASGGGGLDLYGLGQEAPGGRGGVVTATVPVTGTVTITVGTRGTDGSPGVGAGQGGTPGGGDGSVAVWIPPTVAGGGGGGGYSDVSAGTDVLVRAAGGGGGGSGGNLNDPDPSAGGAGGAAESPTAADGAPGLGTVAYGPGLGGHSGATDALGGHGGNGPDADGAPGGHGAAGQGGDGGATGGNAGFYEPIGGGGGGGGAIGGGGGGGGGDNFVGAGAGGGGAGSSAVASSAGDVTRATAAAAGDGSVTATYGNESCPVRAQEVATRCGTATVATNHGTLTDVAATAVPSDPTPPAGLQFACGLIGFTVDDLDLGGSAEITMTFPAGITPTAYWKLQHGSWTQLHGASITGNVVSFTLRDGGTGDADGVPNGRIVDPGGPADPLVASPSFAG
jgi:hypothetical protein